MSTLSRSKQFFLILLSFLCVAFGQPYWNQVLSIAAGCLGYALFWRVLLCYENRWHRFWLAAGWFTSLQLVYLIWFLSHPFYYIYAPYFLLSFLWGVQFGCLGILIKPDTLKSVPKMLGLAGFWAIMEWLRIFILAGYAMNQVGHSLTANIHSLQFASLWGVTGLSFWVILVNLLGLRAWSERRGVWLWGLAAALPFIFGWAHLYYHQTALDNHHEQFTALLVQPSFAVEAEIDNQKDFVKTVVDQWKTMMQLTRKHVGEKLDLVAFPEYVVLFGTYTMIYPYETVKTAFEEIYGPESVAKLPPLEHHLAKIAIDPHGKRAWYVNNAFWLQGIANVFETPVVAGLEDVDDVKGKREHYSAALYFVPTTQGKSQIPNRYEKRVLVPLGEYIPFSFCRQLALAYGIQGSFEPGKEAKVFAHSKAPFGVSICYEEMFGGIMRESRQLNSRLLVNLTSDAWFPNSTLAQQHFDHARARTVENGIPLVRACNTGITGGVDSLGHVVATLEPEPAAGALVVSVPTYTYSTLYSQTGDALIVGIAFLSVLGFLWYLITG